jgi:predicted nucleic acid-binding protein
MNVVDSSAWLSYFANEPCADALAAPLQDRQNLLVPTITLTEVFKTAARQRDEQSAMRAVAQMKRGRVIPLDDSLAIEAARFGLRHKLPLADSIIYATARRFDALLWTRDGDFKDLPGVRFLP